MKILKILKSVPLFVWLVLAVSFILHIFFMIKNPGAIFVYSPVNSKGVATYGAVDALNYTLTAQQLIEKGVFGYVFLEPSPKPVPNAYITPGQPIYLAIIMLFAKAISLNFVKTAISINMILDLLTILTLYFIGLELFGKKIYGIIAATAYGFYFGQYHYFRTMLTETPSIFFLCQSVFWFVKGIRYNKKRYHILFGILFSILLMFRPNPAPILVVGLVILLFKYRLKGSMKIGLLWIIGPILVIFPWVLRNYITLHQFILFSTQSGNPLLAGTDPYNLQGFDSVSKDMAAVHFTDQKAYAIYRIKEGFKYNANLWFSWFTVGKFVELFKSLSGSENYKVYQFYPLLAPYHFFVVGSAFLTIFISALNTPKHKALMCLALVFFVYVGFSNIFLAITRYGYFIIPILCLIFSYGVVSIIQYSRVLFHKEHMISRG